MRPPRSRAFTLLETLLVLAIIGVMAALALPSWRSSVRTRGSVSSLRILSFAWSHSAGSGETVSAPPWDTRSMGPDSGRGIWPLTDRSSAGDAGSTVPAGRLNHPA